MAFLRLSRGLSENLPPAIRDGSCYVTMDEPAIYVDITDRDRIRIGNIQGDYNQNNPDAADYIKNRPCFEGDDGYHPLSPALGGMPTLPNDGSGANKLVKVTANGAGYELAAPGEMEDLKGSPPVKGVDYFTTEDKDEMIDLVKTAIQEDGGGVIVYRSPKSIPIRPSMQIICYAAGAGQISFTMGEKEYTHRLNSSDETCWMLWVQTGDIDGSFIFPSGSRTYLITGSIVTNAQVVFTPDDSRRPDMAYIVITSA